MNDMKEEKERKKERICLPANEHRTKALDAKALAAYRG